MAVDHPSRLALVGLHGSGKTSYIAALWTIVRRDGAVPGALSLATVPDNSEYLSKISSDWLRCNEPEHTPTEGLQTVELELKNESGDVIAMSAPDLSGETYRDLFVARTMAPHLVELLEDVSGLLLVIHPDYQGEGVPIDDMDAELAALDIPGDEEDDEDDESQDDEDDDEEEDPVDSDDPEAAKAKRFKRKRVISQVKVVDVMQAILYHLDEPPRIVVLISAWDLLEKLNKTPREWLDNSLPMLSQYLEGLEEVVVFGLSAQGGQFEKKDDPEEQIEKVEELRQLPPAERPRIVNESGEASNDLTLPLRHLLEG